MENSADLVGKQRRPPDELTPRRRLFAHSGAKEAERRRLEGATIPLSEREQRLLRNLLHSLDFPLYVIDATTYEIVLANATVCREQPPWGVPCYSFTHRRKSPCSGTDGPCPVEVVRRTRRPVVVEHRHYDATGKARYFEIHAVPVLGHDGSVTEIIEYNIDVTERRINAETLRAHERSLELLVSQLEISNRELANFASVAAHDIRSPLQTIAASAAALEVILGDQVKDDARRALTTLMRGIERLKGTITSLYRCCQVATAALDPVDIDLARLVGELCRFQLAADLERSKGRVCVAEPLHGFRGDESQILELMQNLISNALKFRRETTIPEVTVRTLALGDGWIRIEVEDNGAGIRAEDQQRIFEMFTRLEESRVADGLGLGLAVCHRVVQRHGGRIGVESTYGSGSTFWVEFPPRA